jgi:hypothetical protein
MNQDVPTNFSFVPSIGSANRLRLDLPFCGRRVTIYSGVTRLGHVEPIAEECFRAFDSGNKHIGPYADIGSAALGLWRIFLMAEEEAARIKAGHPPTPTFDRKEPVYAGGVLIGTVNVFSDGTGLAFDGAGKLLGLLPAVDLAKKICQGMHNGEAGISSNSLN